MFNDRTSLALLRAGMEDLAAAPEGKARRGRRRGGGQTESRARVLGAARSLFARLGFESTSIRQIASELDIVSASLYHHFLTKEEMLHEILRAPLHRLAERAVSIANEPTDAEHRLISLIVMRIQAWLEDWDAHAIAVNDAQFLMLQEDFAYVGEAKRQSYLAMESVLREGMEQGQFRPDLDVYYTIISIAGILNSAARSLRIDEAHAVEPPSAMPIERFGELLVDFVLRMVRASSRISDPIPMGAPR